MPMVSVYKHCDSQRWQTVVIQSQGKETQTSVKNGSAIVQCKWSYVTRIVCWLHAFSA